MITAQAGTWVLKPRGQWHTFWNAADEPCRTVEIVSPSGFQQYFRDLAEIGGDMAQLARLKSVTPSTWISTGALRQSPSPYSWTYTEVWMIPGPQTGRGPRGYQRSDDRIKEEVCERLTQHGDIDAAGIEVIVQDGEVTISGSVDSRQAKRQAEDAVESVAGVRDVRNQLRTIGDNQRGRAQTDGGRQSPQSSQTISAQGQSESDKAEGKRSGKTT